MAAAVTAAASARVTVQTSDALPAFAPTIASRRYPRRSPRSPAPALRGATIHCTLRCWPLVQRPRSTTRRATAAAPARGPARSRGARGQTEATAGRKRDREGDGGAVQDDDGAQADADVAAVRDDRRRRAFGLATRLPGVGRVGRRIGLLIIFFYASGLACSTGADYDSTIPQKDRGVVGTLHRTRLGSGQALHRLGRFRQAPGDGGHPRLAGACGNARACRHHQRATISTDRARHGADRAEIRAGGFEWSAGPGRRAPQHREAA